MTHVEMGHYGVARPDDAWLREQYTLATMSEEPFCLVSIKLKFFRAYSHSVGEEQTHQTLCATYDALRSALQEGECCVHIFGCYFNALIKAPANMDVLHIRARDFHLAVRDKTEELFGRRLYLGMGFYPMTKPNVSFFDAQYYADLCRVESLECKFQQTHYDFYGLSYINTKEKFAKLEKLMEKSLHEGDFKLYLQPKVDAATGEVHSAEALVRWVHPEYGMIPLSDFMEGFETNGFIRDVDLYLFDKACGYMEKWLKQYKKQFCISFNLSKAYFAGDYFVPEITEAFERYDLPKSCVRIELLESIVADDIERLRWMVDSIYNYGFSCAIDDFGSGFSSFDVLTNVALSELKIDRSLFLDETNERARLLVKKIIEVGHELGMEVVAEGIETAGYAEYLRDLSCDYIQGFFYYKPMPVDEFEQRFVIATERVSVHTGKPLLP